MTFFRKWITAADGGLITKNKSYPLYVFELTLAEQQAMAFREAWYKLRVRAPW